MLPSFPQCRDVNQSHSGDETGKGKVKNKRKDTPSLNATRRKAGKGAGWSGHGEEGAASQKPKGPALQEEREWMANAAQRSARPTVGRALEGAHGVWQHVWQDSPKGESLGDNGKGGNGDVGQEWSLQERASWQHGV